ncbi:MAG: bis(5'-nucleosyl)-tetraphosphatase (symmetrical) YqeK [Clostridia bacterium]|nr:bis(5'-nucleosyl)-tetraphosphatase (symmetrical) YqeK [Clostridia bacterium]
MIEVQKMKSYLEERLSPKRYNHSLGVADEAVRLAKRYGADEEKAYLAGLVHDSAKEVNPETAIELLEKRYGEKVEAVARCAPKLLHGPLGAHIAKSEFEICDAEILDAVRYHTTAKADMDILTKIIYIADYIEPNRSFDGVDELRKVAYEDIDESIITGIDYTLAELLEAGRVFHPDTVYARNYLILQRQG